MSEMPFHLAGQQQAAGLIPPGSTTFHPLLAVHIPAAQLVHLSGRRRWPSCATPRGSEGSHVDGLEALLALVDVELDGLSLIQRAVTASLDGTEVHEEVLAGFGADEAVALVSVEPLDPWVPQLEIRPDGAGGLLLAWPWGDQEPLTELEAGGLRLGENHASPERVHFRAVVDGLGRSWCPGGRSTASAKPDRSTAIGTAAADAIPR